LVLAAFPLFLLWRVLFAGEVFFWGTPFLQFVPWQRMASEMWRAGQVPLWNPLVGCGAPLAANYQTAAFYPLNALALVLPAEVALSWATALHLALAGWGLYMWARVIGLDPFSAFVGGLAFMGSGFLVARVALFPSIVYAFPWLAVWLWRAELLTQRLRLRNALWFGLAVGLGLLAGHAQTAFYGAVLVGAYLLFRNVQSHLAKHRAVGRQRSAFWRPLLRYWSLVGIASVVGVGLAAVQLLPTGELLAQSSRSAGVDYEVAVTYSLWPWRLITFFAPDFFGNPGRGDYWGYANYWEGAGHIGTLPLLLAIGIIFARQPGRSRSAAGQVGFLAGCAVIGILLALGKNLPIFPWIFGHVPGFDLFQAPDRWLAVVTIALAGLAALGARRWQASRSGLWSGRFWLTIGVAIAAGGLIAPKLVDGIPGTFSPATVRLGATMAVAGALRLLRTPLCRHFGSSRGEAGWRALVAAFVMLDLLLCSLPLIPSVDRSLYAETPELAEALRSGSRPVRVYWPTDPSHQNLAYDAEHRVKFGYFTFDDFGPADVAHWHGLREAMLPNAAMLAGLPAANNYEPLLVGRYVDVLNAVVSAPELLRLMGVSHVVSDASWPDGEPVQMQSGFTAYEIPKSYGRAWTVPAARHVAEGDALTALSEPGFDPQAEVLLEIPNLPSSPRQPRESDENGRGWFSELVLQDGMNRVTIRATLQAPGYLVLADTWYPGWQAWVDGDAVPVLRANHTFRAVRLEAGDHVVEMVYAPASVRWGGAISLVALLGLIAGLVIRRRA
jgi:hypothetical protein